MPLVARPYVARVNHGGNFCGHSPDAPRLALTKPTTDKKRPQILQLLQARIQKYYQKPSMLPSLNAANQSKQGRQQRSERREACIQLLTAILEHTDLVSLRCGIPTANGFISLTLDYLIKFTGLQKRRAERAMADLKRANLLTVAQPKQLKEDGSWCGLAAIKAVNKLLFTVFGLGRRLTHERDRAAGRLKKKIKQTTTTLTSWARSALVINQKTADRPKRQPARRPQGPTGRVEQEVRVELLLALKQAYPDLSAAEVNAEADRILEQKKLKA